MRLVDLEPVWVRYETRIESYNIIVGAHETWRERGCPTQETTGPREYIIPVESFAEAQGIRFLCPKCYSENTAKLEKAYAGAGLEEARIGIHSCSVSLEGRGVQPTQGSHSSKGEPVRWTVIAGDSFDTLTLTPSILLEGGCEWHGYITNGEIS